MGSLERIENWQILSQVSYQQNGSMRRQKAKSHNKPIYQLNTSQELCFGLSLMQITSQNC